MENLTQKIDTPIPITKEKELNFKSFVMGFHEYRKIWKPKPNEILEVELEPTNKMDKFGCSDNKEQGNYWASSTW